LIALIADCWGLYPDIILDVDAELPELHVLASYYAGALWVAEEQGIIVGMIATRPDPETKVSWEICRVYVHPDRHGGGLGHALLDIAEAYALSRGAQRLFLWSDTRFTRAHRFYEKRTYQRVGEVRALHDLSHSHEFCFEKATARRGALPPWSALRGPSPTKG
jgi:GNAT superfamily N-acetyltransferase